MVSTSPKTHAVPSVPVVGRGHFTRLWILPAFAAAREGGGEGRGKHPLLIIDRDEQWIDRLVKGIDGLVVAGAGAEPSAEGGAGERD